MAYRTTFFLFALSALFLGCGSNGESTSDELFGDCPRIDPSPRALSDSEYGEVCGADCDAIFALQMDDAGERATESFFVACAPEEVPLPTWYPGIRRGCLNSPRDGRAYYFPSPRYRARMMELGWELCGVPGYTIDADTLQCGQLEGVEPVEPEVIGVGKYGCPIVRPVPCTKPQSQYRDVCGPDCWPATVLETNQEATPWFAGCYPGHACPDVDFNTFYCVVDPFVNRTFEFNPDGCQYPQQTECSTGCDPDIVFAPPPAYCSEALQ